ncbi:MAG: NUDIX hydrolase [Planctomycetes bacterium]|jgi:ADP-ribose pyrophosphatase|nr:NUDIX hydrolase [Planctomycetota bacterium]
MWKTVSSKEIFNHPRLTLIEDEIILPNGHKINYLKDKDNGGCAVTIIAKRDGKILIQREYSYPPNQKLFQFPGGAVPAGEEPEVGANRELMEEMGFRANKLELLGSYLINNRRSKMKMYVYVGTDLVEKSLDADPEEDIESFWFSEDEIARMIKNGDIINVHSLASWCLYKN